METITANYFAHLVKGIHEKSGSRRFCFILGAGASRSSGIPTGSELAKRWYEELQNMLTPSEFEKWKTSESIDENDLGTYYGIIYNKRFHNDPESGYEDLNKAMEHAKPSFGYSVLAKILSVTHHNIVITTNFDSLTEASLYYYTGKHPLVCSHESLSGFAKPDGNRPLIAKIHRDLLMSPMSDPGDIKELYNGWKESLDNILSTHIPIVIGYGGNDGSLMGYLEGMIRKPSNMFWCVRTDSVINDRVKNVVAKLNGKLVATEGFDHLMFDLLFAMQDVKLLDGEIEEEAKRRSNDYKEQVKKIQDDKNKSSNPDDKLNAQKLSIKTKQESPYSFMLRADAETDIAKREQIYLEGLDKFPNSPTLNVEVAHFYHTAKENFEYAEKFYLKALELDSSDSYTNTNYAIFLKNVRQDYQRAESYYLKAINADPNNAHAIGSYALFLDAIRNNYNEAEKHYLKAMELDPNDADYFSNYAMLLDDTLKKYPEAEMYYLKALEINPDDSFCHGNYAVFLSSIRKNYKQAEKHAIRALELNPDDASLNANYAQLCLASGRKDEAEKHIIKALWAAKKEGVYLELWFYRYAHYPEIMEEAEIKLNELLDKGVKSPGWDFSINIERAIADGHPYPEKLKEYARRISEE